MAYKRKNKKNKIQDYNESLDYPDYSVENQENKEFVQNWLEKQEENEEESLSDWDNLDDEIFENHEPLMPVDVDDFYINELAKEMFPDGSGMEEFRVIFKIGYKRAIHDYNNGDIY